MAQSTEHPNIPDDAEPIPGNQPMRKTLQDAAEYINQGAAWADKAQADLDDLYQSMGEANARIRGNRDKISDIKDTLATTEGEAPIVVTPPNVDSNTPMTVGIDYFHTTPKTDCVSSPGAINYPPGTNFATALFTITPTEQQTGHSYLDIGLTNARKESGYDQYITITTGLGTKVPSGHWLIAAFDSIGSELFNIKEDGSIYSSSDFKIGTTSKENESVSLKSIANFVQTIPTIEYGTSNSLNVPAASSATFDVTFKSTKTEAPVMFFSVQCASASAPLLVHAQSVSNTQAAVVVENASNSDISNVTIDWLALSGR